MCVTVRAMTESEYNCFYCGTCHHEEAWFGPMPDEYQFVCNCEEDEE